MARDQKQFKFPNNKAQTNEALAEEQDCSFSQGPLLPLCTHIINAPRPRPSLFAYRWCKG